ncbi:MAG TPA: hypothetical protein ENI20_10730 [Bacteroides sp.]|nr:hypothetical protein [Bacteroides sp.]
MKITIVIAGLMLNAIFLVRAQDDTFQNEVDTININGLEDLKSALQPATLFTVLEAMESWMPTLVSSLNWNTQMSSNIILNYYIDHSDENDGIFEDFLAESDKIIADLETFFELEQLNKQGRLASASRLNCFVIKVKSDFTFGTLPDPHLLFYYLDPERDPKYMQRFRHEYAHWTFGRIYGEAPSLFYEGVATYAEKMSGKNPDAVKFRDISFQLEDVPPINELADNDSFWKCKNNYTISALFIDFLVSKWGWAPLKDLYLSSDYDDPDIQNHFREVYGLSMEEVEPDWRNYLESGQELSFSE